MDRLEIFHTTMHAMQMVSVYRDPEGKTIFSKSNPSSAPISTGDNEWGNNPTIESLQCKVKDLQFALSKYEPHLSEETKKRSSKVTFIELEKNEQHSSNE